MGTVIKWKTVLPGAAHIVSVSVSGLGSTGIFEVNVGQWRLTGKGNRQGVLRWVAVK